MRSQRGWQRSATCTALFALLLQFVLSFGHVHAGLADRHAASATAASGQSDRFCALPDQDRGGDDHANGHCAICATIKLLGQGWAASPPALLVRRASYGSPPPCRASAALGQGPATGFRSRAPPLA